MGMTAWVAVEPQLRVLTMEKPSVAGLGGRGAARHPHHERVRTTSWHFGMCPARWPGPRAVPLAGLWLRQWRRRYFALVGNKIYFSVSPSVGEPPPPPPPGPLVFSSLDCPTRSFEWQEPPHGVIDLSKCPTIKSADDKTGKPHSFEVATLDRTYFMYVSCAVAVPLR
jgi:hypothetical protein